jgi:HPt (histidine-containing phosphotransfer) domain-containing protein
MSDELAAVRARFCERTVLQATELRNYLAAGDLQASGLERLVHTLAGTGAMLGFAELAATAAEIDDLYAAGKTPTLEALESLALAMEALANGA